MRGLKLDQEAVRRTLDCVRRALTASCVVPGLVLAPIPAAGQADLDAAVDTFVAITEQGEFGAKATGITRWARPIRIATAGRPTADQRAALGEHVSRLRQRMRLPLDLVEPLAASREAATEVAPIDLSDPLGIFQILYHLPAHGWATYLLHGRGEQLAVARGDLMLVFAAQPSVLQIARVLRLEAALLRQVANGDMPCFAFFYTDPGDHEIRYGIVVLRTDVTEITRRRCLHEELTQVMGLRNDVKGSELTLFDDTPSRRRTELTPHDWIFLEVLYDPRLKPGTRGAELRRMARALIAERWPPR